VPLLPQIHRGVGLCYYSSRVQCRFRSDQNQLWLHISISFTLNILPFCVSQEVVDMSASPFKEMAVDDELNVYVMGPSIPHKQAVLVSINGVTSEEIIAHAQDQEPESWKTSLNALLPSIISVVGAALSSEAKVVVKDRRSVEHELTLSCPEDKSGECIEAVKNQYASILRLAALSGLTPKDMSCVFNVCMVQLGLGEMASGMPEQMMEGMQGMAQQMAQGMAGGQGGQGGQCQQQ
jgi:hypothetical protein